MNGCLRSQTLRELNRAFSCYNLSEAQQKIIWILQESGFGSLRVTQPSWWNENDHYIFNYVREWNRHHPAGSRAVDLVVTKEPLGSGIPHFELMRAFVALSQVWPGGIGIGIANADPHLHVDLNSQHWVRWVEIDKQESNRRWIIYNHEKDYPAYFRMAQRYHGYYGSGDVDWHDFFAQRNMTPDEILDNIVDTVSHAGSWIESMTKWVVIGLLAHFGAKAIGLLPARKR